MSFIDNSEYYLLYTEDTLDYLQKNCYHPILNRKVDFNMDGYGFERCILCGKIVESTKDKNKPLQIMRKNLLEKQIKYIKAELNVEYRILELQINKM